LAHDTYENYYFLIERTRSCDEYRQKESRRALVSERNVGTLIPDLLLGGEGDAEVLTYEHPLTALLEKEGRHPERDQKKEGQQREKSGRAA